MNLTDSLFALPISSIIYNRLDRSNTKMQGTGKSYEVSGETTEWEDILIKKGITSKESVLLGKGLNPKDVSENKDIDSSPACMVFTNSSCAEPHFMFYSFPFLKHLFFRYQFEDKPKVEEEEEDESDLYGKLEKHITTLDELDELEVRF